MTNLQRKNYKKLLDLSARDLKFVLLLTFPYSRYNDQAIDRATDESWFCSRQGQEMFLFQTSRTARWPARLPRQWVSAYLLAGVKLTPHFHLLLKLKRGTRWRSCLRHCATSRKVAGSIPDGVIGIFQ